MTNSKLVPRRRFKEFESDGEWEQKILSELAEVEGGGTPSTVNSQYWDGDIDWYTPAEIGESVFVGQSKRKITVMGLEKSSAKILPIGTVLFTSRAGIGKTAILAREGCTNQGFQSIVPKEDLLASYFVYSQSNKLKQYGERIGSGSTFVEVSGKQMSEMPLIIPSIFEQKELGDFFQTIDSLISNHQHKLDKLKDLKKAYLTEMFPAEGERVPKRRFPGFEGEWEQMRLGDIAERFDNLRVPVASKDRVSGTIPYYGANGIQDYVDGFTHNGEFVLLAEDGANDLKNYPVHYVKGKIWVNNHAHVIQGKEDLIDNQFLLFAVKQIQIEPYLVGGGRAKLNADIMMDLPLIIPEISEQKSIGSFLMTLDKRITLQQQKLDKLNDLKKAYLNELFV